MLLTEALIKDTEFNPTKRITLTDGGGLQLRITKTDKRSWSLQYRFHGSMKKLTLGSWPAVSCKRARRLADEARYLIARGIDPQVEKQKAKAKKLKMAEVWQTYDQMHISRNLKNKTAKDYRCNARNDILPSLGKLNIDEIEKAHIVRLVDTIAERAPVLANRTLGLTSHFLKWCVGRGYLETNPALGIPKALKETPRERVLSLSEMRQIYQATEHISQGNRLFVRLLMLTGQREAVIAQLTLQEFKGDILEIAGVRNKSGSRILVPLSEIAQEQIRELGCKNGPYIVSTTEGAKPVSGFSKLKKKIDVISGISSWRFHDFRRGISTHLEDQGVDRFYVERILNHKDRSVTGIYAKSEHQKRKSNILEQWSKVLTSENGWNAENVLTFLSGASWKE